MEEKISVKNLELDTCIGFSGKVVDGLKISKCGNYIIYPLGKVLVVKSKSGSRTHFLEAHDNEISCVAISKDGMYIASGQINQLGVRADICLWNADALFKSLSSNGTDKSSYLITRFQQHSGKVQYLDFSCDGRFLASIGGQDDNMLIIWDIEKRASICGAPGAQDSVLSVKWLNLRNDRLVTAGYSKLRVWQIQTSPPKINAVDAKMGTVKRIITSIAIADDDTHAVCGTRTGDLLKFKIDRDDMKPINDPDTKIPLLTGCSKEKFKKAVRTILPVFNPKTGATNFLVGAGDGFVTFVNPKLCQVRNYSCQLLGGVTSLVSFPDLSSFYSGTDRSNRYWLSSKLDVELRGTSHHGAVNDVVFPADCSTLFATCSFEDVRVWDLKRKRELLRIQVPNLECTCIGISKNGSTIVTGWSDGKVRGFYPEKGKLKFVLDSAHTDGITSLAVTRDDDLFPPWRIITGGRDGRVRVWKITPTYQNMEISWKEHRGSVTSIKVSNDNTQCITSGEDGSCIVWDLERGIRLMALFESTVFKCVTSHPDDSQYLTCGSNHKIVYWDAYDCTPIREIECSSSGLNSLDVDKAGQYFVCGGDDYHVTVWLYEEGTLQAVGKGHSSQVNKVQISPDGEYVISVGADGAVMIWKMLRS